MCGIFGIITTQQAVINYEQLQKHINQLFLLSETRGKEAAGIAIVTNDNVWVNKSPDPAHTFITTKSYVEYWKHIKEQAYNTISVIGHSRLVTNGLQSFSGNNQPIAKDGVVGVHNGIVVNDTSIWKKFPDLEKKYDVDSEVIFSLLKKFIHSGNSLESATIKTFKEITGETSIACFFDDKKEMLIATNTGSIYYQKIDAALFFASERYILEKFNKKNKLSNANITHLKAQNGLIVDLETLDENMFSLKDNAPLPSPKNEDVSIKPIIIQTDLINEKRKNLKRCTKCILPETMPYIRFNDDGVCSYCLHYKKAPKYNRKYLEKLLSKHRKNNGEPDCVIAVSGGRDSCYGLHLLVNEYGMNPLAFTYDWGMVTDISRRNQSRMCSQLGIEHIWVSADIKQKHKNIQRNVGAWLAKPDLGMIPIFMAGDKQFYYYAHQVLKQNKLNLLIMCENRLERTDFKTGFCGVAPMHDRTSGFRLNIYQNIKLLSYYLKQYIVNPRYVNKSLLDTIFAYFSFYMMKHDYLLLFHHHPWVEDEVNNVLLNQYGWETSSETSSTWRIGDGTAAFYNYIYYTVAGFTEFDTMRSNQIREGHITRSEAVEYIKKEHLPQCEARLKY